MKKEELIEVLNQLFWRSHLDKENYQSAIEETDLLLNEINKRSNETKAVRQNEQTQEVCAYENCFEDSVTSYGYCEKHRYAKGL